MPVVRDRDTEQSSAMPVQCDTEQASAMRVQRDA